MKEQINEKRIQVEEIQQQLLKREEELTATLLRIDEESAAKANAQKIQRELESQLIEIQEDLEAEKVARSKAEKQKRDLNEELEALKNELLDSLDTTAGNFHQIFHILINFFIFINQFHIFFFFYFLQHNKNCVQRENKKSHR